MFELNLRKHYGSAGAVLLLLVFLGELTFSIRQQSLSWDEGDHIFAGYMSWKKVDFGINPEHPPLVKALAAIPLLPIHLKVPDPKGLASFKDEAYFDGRDFIFGNGGEAEADRIIFRARMAAASLSLLLGLLVFLAAREMFGDGAALFALALVVFEPNMIAHGAYVTTDMGISCFMFASIYAFYRYVKAPSVGRLIVLGLVSGLALASKHSGVLLLPFGLALIITEILWSSPETQTNKRRVALRLTGAFLAASTIAIVVLWAFYGFRYAARPGGMQLSPSLAEYARGLKGLEPQVYLALARPDLFSKAASQSGAFLLAQDRILNLARDARAAQSFYFDVGKYEQRFIPSHLVLVEALKARGCRCLFQELAGGHNWTSWRAHLKDLLVFLWPAGTAEAPKRATRRRRKQR